jgi:hypothetical protein
MLYNQFKIKKRAAWGHSLAFWKAKFDQLGEQAWNTINRFIVDDQAIPYLFSQTGQKIVFKNIYCPVQWSGKTWNQVHQQKKYWVLFQKAGVGNGLLFLFGMTLYPVIPSTLFMLYEGFSFLSVSAWLVVFGTRVLASLLAEVFYTRSYTITLKYFWTIFIWDMIQPYYYAYAFIQKTIRHSGKEYRIVDRYFLESV